MKKIIRLFCFLIVLILLPTIVAAEFWGTPITLSFTSKPVLVHHIYKLPNGSFLLDYDTPDTSEFWQSLGRNDITHHITEVFAPSGESLWHFQDGGDIAPEDAENYLYQYAIYQDRIIYEHYDSLSMENYHTIVWNLNGDFIENPMNAIHQDEENARYLYSMYPYILKIWKTGDVLNHQAVLCNVTKNTIDKLPYYGGSRTTFVEKNYFYMLFAQNSEVKLLSCNSSEKVANIYTTSLETESGLLLTDRCSIYFLKSIWNENGYTYTLLQAPIPDNPDYTLQFVESYSFQVTSEDRIDSIFKSADSIFFLINHNNEYSYLAQFVDNQLRQIHKWSGEAQLIDNSDGDIYIFVSDIPVNNCYITSIPAT